MILTSIFQTYSIQNNHELQLKVDKTDGVDRARRDEEEAMLLEITNQIKMDEANIEQKMLNVKEHLAEIKDLED